MFWQSWRPQRVFIDFLFASHFTTMRVIFLSFDEYENEEEKLVTFCTGLQWNLKVSILMISWAMTGVQYCLTEIWFLTSNKKRDALLKINYNKCETVSCFTGVSRGNTVAAEFFDCLFFMDVQGTLAAHAIIFPKLLFAIHSWLATDNREVIRGGTQMHSQSVVQRRWDYLQVSNETVPLDVCSQKNCYLAWV